MIESPSGRFWILTFEDSSPAAVYVPMTTPMQAVAEGSPKPNPDILRRLRTESRAEHEAIDRALDLLARGLTLGAYRRRIEQFHGFYAPLEDRLGDLGALAWPSGAAPLERRAPLLAADLVALGVGAPERLPRCEALPELRGPADVLGCLYVLEGAALGGQVIARHLRDTLGIGPSNGGSFFHGRAEQTGPHWRAFCATLAAFRGDDAEGDATVQAAIATFRALRRWCAAGEPREPEATHE